MFGDSDIFAERLGFTLKHQGRDLTALSNGETSLFLMEIGVVDKIEK
jgi:hypothetical protein